MEPGAKSGFLITEKRIKIYSIFLAMLLFAAGCAGKEGEKSILQEEETVKIPVIFTVNPITGKKSNLELVEDFNAEYKGRYHVEVEWVMETEEEYRQNLKRLNVTDELPAVITDLRMLPSFYQMMIQDERLENLKPYLDRDPKWAAMVEPVVMEGCLNSPEEIYLAPISTAAFSCSGMFWNAELFARAGIYEFPQTWEEFWECCDTLLGEGITPLALHTEGTAWAPMLVATAELADSEEGARFMKQLFPESYQNKNGIRLAETLRRLFEYTTKDAMHTDFDVAYTNFFSGKAAMIPNGYWMIEQIPENWVERVRFSPFPGNKLVSSPETFGWAVVSDYSQEVKEGAVEFLKFRTRYNKEERERLIGSRELSDSLATRDYIEAFLKNPQIVPNYQVKWNSIFQEETLGEYLPPLIEGKMTVEEFTKMADESIREFEEEQ